MDHRKEYKLGRMNGEEERFGDTTGLWQILWRDQNTGSILSNKPWKPYPGKQNLSYEEAEAALSQLEKMQ